MAGDWFTNLTLISNFLCMAIALWFAIYLVARSPNDPLTFRAVAALLALAFYYNSSFTDIVNFNLYPIPQHSLATLIAVVATHSLTHHLLPLPQRKKLYWKEAGVILLGVAAIVVLYTVPLSGSCDPRYTCSADLEHPWPVYYTIGVIFIAILYNLLQIGKNVRRSVNLALFAALLLGVSTIVYTMVGMVSNIPLPRLLSNLIMLAALALLLYSVARAQTFVIQRSYTYDLPITMLTVVFIVALYVLFAWQVGLSTVNTLLLAVLAIFTHSAYDLVRQFIERMFRTQEGRLRHELRQLARQPVTPEALPRFLDRGLAILCHNLRAPNGMVAMRQGDAYQVVASLHCLPVGWQFPAREIPPESSSGLEKTFLGFNLWLVPAYLGPEIVVIVGVGSRLDQTPYSEEDYYWLEDIAEEIGFMLSVFEASQRVEKDAQPGQPAETGQTLFESLDDLDTDDLLTKLAYKPDLELVRCVEESLRNLYDYSELGKSSLVESFGIQAPDHIERGKQLQRRLVDTIEELRPTGPLPKEPLPREWYAYTILHDAYVENALTRDIMSKLYISERTYFRMRRQAVRGVARAMLETGAVF
jgi:hypothetical protein